MNTREIVLDALMEVLEKGKQSHIVLGQTLKKYPELEKRDRSFITRLFNGTIERLLTLDYDIERFSKIKTEKMKPLIRTILRMSMYQIRYMEQIPDSAVCNEAVKLAKKRGFQSLSGYVNGVLRSAVRNKEQLSEYPKNIENRKLLSLQYSMPEWIVKDFMDWYGAEKTKEILSSFMEEKATSIRVNESKISKSDLVLMLSKENVKVTEGSFYPLALQISDYDNLDKLEAFQKGYFQVQDESSMLVGLAAGVKAGDHIIDVCAAPGGKALHLSELLTVLEEKKSTSQEKKDTSQEKKSTSQEKKDSSQEKEVASHGVVDARDLTERKVGLIQENIDRVKAKNIIARVQDALETDPASIGTADIVIADLPCSGIGVIGKKADIKYKMRKEQQEELAKLQRDILNVVSSYVKKGGILIYSTCTINKAENEDNFNYIKENLPFVPESLTGYLPDSLDCESMQEGYIQLLPGIHHTDGFFISRFRRV